jgi:hypothetical protein
MPKQTRAPDPHRENQQRSAHRKAEQTPAAASAAEAGRLQRLPQNPTAASATDLTQMQARYGNRAVQSLLKSHNVQAKLEVGPANDHCELEADRVAQQVMRMPADAAKDEDEEKP